MATTGYRTEAATLSQERIDSYRRNGFVRIPGVISGQEVDGFRRAALELQERMQDRNLTAGGRSAMTFDQFVNVWREDERMRALSLHPNVGAIAERLAGVPLRLWHDQILIKRPQRSVPTEFHQDQPYWPHDNSPNALTAWIALCDVPFERGCMTFIPGSHRRDDLAAQNLNDAHDLFDKAPELAWEERVTVPLRAGDCTFHHARCAHMANANLTEEPRVAHAILMMDAVTTYRQAGHVITDPLSLEPGQVLDGPVFPRVGA
jgi:ectoine hydroxylase-related dioxygenase (phytanoyl-CoA dioxygenase family)